MKLQRIDDNRWRIPREGKMRVEGIVYASDAMRAALRDDPALEQVKNVACLPGIVRASLAMPDIHWGYGFPIGGVAAFDLDDGVVSPGGVGYDINCGVRLLRSDVSAEEAAGRMRDLVEALFRSIPTGVGSPRKDIRLDAPGVIKVLRDGAGWAVKNGFGEADDLLH